MKNTFLFGLLVLLLAACSDSTLEEVDMNTEGRNFVPLHVGSTWTFDLDSIIFDPEPGMIVIDTIQYEMQYVVVDSMRDDQDRVHYTIDRFLRKSDSMPWQIRDVWTAVLDDKMFVWTEENLPYIKMVFPMDGTARWDGNALFNDDDTRVNVRGELLDMFKFWGQYSANGVADQETINGQSYDDVVTITAVDREISIEKRFSQEKYARNVGLIYQRIEILDTQNENVVLPFEQRAERGFIVEIRRK